MLINSSLPPESTAADLQNGRAATPASAPARAAAPPASPTPSSDPAASRMRGPSPAEQDGEGTIQDGAAADQAADFLSANFFAQPGLALAAQAHQNPETVFALLQ
jgi:hypothetical protein